MAANPRRQSLTLKEALTHEGFRFDFFQAIRILESFGKFEKARKHGINYRFHTRLALDFPASAIDYVYEDKSLYHLIVNFMGLTGPQGVLPRHYTEDLISRSIIQKDHTAHDYFDMFSHRMISLFYQAWKKHQVWVEKEQNNKSKIEHYFLDIIGLGTQGLQKRLEVNKDGFYDENLIYYSGLLSQKPHSISALKNILEDYFHCLVNIEQCTGKWLHLPLESQTKLSSHNPYKLGESTVLGARVWDRQSNLKITVKNLSYEEFQKFLPDGSFFLIMQQFISFYLHNQFDFQIELQLKKDEIPNLSLESSKDNPVKLGWSTWIGKVRAEKKPQNPVFSSRKLFT